MDRKTFSKRLGSAAFAFRGYNVTNLGRSPELLRHPVYGPVMRASLLESGQIASEIMGRSIDLVGRVEREEETTLACYDEAIALILAAEQAQLTMLERFHALSASDAACFCGYSLGEVQALVAAGSISRHDALRVPLSLAADCVELAEDVTLAVLFSRAAMIDLNEVDKICYEVNREGAGVIGVSAELSPNSLLLMGQGQSLDRFRELASQKIEQRIQIRKNDNRWPPLHTPIVWQRAISDRAADLMHTLEQGDRAPSPPVLSLVTGAASYTDTNVRTILRLWTDHRQELWKVVLELVDRGIETLVHVGPAPNIIPATFQRISDNVAAQTRASVGMRTLSTVAARPWLRTLLPKRTMLLNVVRMEHVILEDWLLENEPSD